MPLMNSKSKAAFSSNVAELLHSFKKKGKIGNQTPESMAKARKTALAIAFKIKSGGK